MKRELNLLKKMKRGNEIVMFPIQELYKLADEQPTRIQDMIEEGYIKEDISIAEGKEQKHYRISISGDQLLKKEKEKNITIAIGVISIIVALIFGFWGGKTYVSGDYIEELNQINSSYISLNSNYTNLFNECIGVYNEYISCNNYVESIGGNTQAFEGNTVIGQNIVTYCNSNQEECVGASFVTNVN